MSGISLETKKQVVIKCPHCGWEYVPAELFMPTDLEGKPDGVIRDALGKVLYAEYPEGYNPGESASYYCDNCGKAFIVEPTITYKVRKESEELDFSSTTASLLD